MVKKPNKYRCPSFALRPLVFESWKKYSVEDQGILLRAMLDFAFRGKKPNWPANDSKWAEWNDIVSEVELTKSVKHKQRRDDNGAE